jgi:hypothetical protein
VTTILDLVGAVFVVSAAFAALGLAAALAVAGCACLIASWSMSGGKP